MQLKRLVYAVVLAVCLHSVATADDDHLATEILRELIAINTAPSGGNDLRPAMPPERIHLWASRDDRFFPPAGVEAMWKRWGRPPITWVPGSHMGFVARLPLLLPKMRRFVDDLALT